MASASMMTEAIKGLNVEEALYLVDLFSQMMQGRRGGLGTVSLGGY